MQIELKHAHELHEFAKSDYPIRRSRRYVAMLNRFVTDLHRYNSRATAGPAHGCVVGEDVVAAVDPEPCVCARCPTMSSIGMLAAHGDLVAIDQRHQHLHVGRWSRR